MADRNNASSGVIAPTGATGVHSTDSGSVVTEFLDAARSAAESLLQEQKRQIAGRVSGIARALQSATQPLHESQNHVIAGYLEEAAAQVHSLSRRIHERHWGELVADTEDFARRQPTWFLLGGVAAGFVLGRLLWASTGRPQDAARSSRSGEPARTVTAAVSSASGTAAGELTGNPHPITGTLETR